MGGLFAKPKVEKPPEIPEPEPMPVPDDKQKKLASQKRVASKIMSKGRESTYISGKTKLG